MIRLESISISRFRGIREGEIKGFADVNLLIGRNNSGKSTVAEAITSGLFKLCNQQGRDPIRRTPDSIWHTARKNAGPPSQTEGWYKHETAHPVSLQLSLTDGQSRKLVYAVQFKADGSITEAEIETNNDTNQPSRKAWEYSSKGGDPEIRFAKGLTVFRPPDAINQDIENVLWDELLKPRLDRALIKALNDIFQTNTEHLQLLPDKRLRVLFPDHSLPLDVQGDGARAALRCLMMLTALQGTLFILEEPECHQHPGSLERFAETLCRQANEQEVQLLISTHSLECVQKFLQGAQKAGSSSALFHLKLEDGLLTASRLDRTTVEALDATGVDVRYLDLYA